MDEQVAVAGSLTFLVSPVSWYHYITIAIPLAMIVFSRMSRGRAIGLSLLSMILVVPGDWVIELQDNIYQHLPGRLGYLFFVRSTYLAILLLAVWNSQRKTGNRDKPTVSSAHA